MKTMKTTIRMYAVADRDLDAAIAGRLLTTTAADLAASTAATTAAYGDGFAAGVTWADELATFVDLQQLADAAAQPFFVAPAWVRGFVDGALRTWRDVNTARYGVA